MQNRNKYLEEIIQNMHTIKIKLLKDIVPKGIGSISLSETQLFVLKTIDERKKINLKDLSEILKITNSASTQLVNTLIKKELLEKNIDTKDKRYTEISLSQKCKKQISSMKKAGLIKLNEVFSALDNKELEEYSKLNRKIAQKIIKNRTKI